MLKLLRNKAYPIGIDLGSSSLKMIQLMEMDGGLGLVAAAREDVPAYVQGHATALAEWYTKTIKDILHEKPFRGKQAITCLSSREMLVQHLRINKMADDELVKALPWEAQGKVPFDINQALLRHIIAGEVYEGDESKLEVILMAASNHAVQQHMHLIERTKLQVGQINIESSAIVNCFKHLLEQNNQEPSVTMLVDLGYHCSTVVVTHGKDIVFCRNVSIAAKHMIQSIMDKLGLEYEQALQKYLELELQSQNQTSNSPASHDAESHETQDIDTADGGQAATAVLQETQVKTTDDIQSIIEPTLQYLCDEIRNCVRYHDLMFSTSPINKVIFLGGLSKNKGICQKLARGLSLPAQLGDPLARVLPASRTGRHSDLEQGQSYSDWAVAFGLSLGSH